MQWNPPPPPHFCYPKRKLEDHGNLMTPPIRPHFHGPMSINGFIGVPLYLEKNSFVEELQVQLEFFKVERQILVIWLPFVLPIIFLIIYNCKLVLFQVLAPQDPDPDCQEEVDDVLLQHSRTRAKIRPKPTD